MNYALLVLASPASGTSNLTAARFARELVKQGHTLSRVFFHDAGTETGLISRVTPQDETDARALWRELAAQHNTELVLCIASSLRHGVLDTTEAERYERTNTIDPAFVIGGLGLLVEASETADRLITFGANA